MSQKTSTTTSIWRSGGGDSTKTSYAGSMLMVADFYFAADAAAETAVQRASNDTRPVILPIGAVVVEIQVNAAGTGGSSPTYDMGWEGYSDSSVKDADGLVAEGDADSGKQVITWATATVPGDDLGVAMSTTQMVKITGSQGASAATGGNISGRLLYYVPTDGAYTS